jgi:purine-binding chemotaxis protein CheW
MQSKRATQNLGRPTNELSLVGFRVADGTFAVEVTVVREILAPAPVVAVPDAARIVMGVIEHRGHVVPIVDLRRRFGLGPLGASRRAKWIVVETGTGWLGLAVDEVTEVFRVDSSHERTAPRVGPSDVAQGFTRVYAYDNRLVMALDLKALAKAIEDNTVSPLPTLAATTGSHAE